MKLLCCLANEKRVVLFAVLLTFTGPALAEICRWKDADGVTHFATSCPLEANVEAIYDGGNIPFGASPPGRSFLIEGADALDARQKVERDQAHIEKLRAMARGNGKGLNQSYSDAIVDAQRRSYARRELDRIERAQAGLPPKTEYEGRLERLEAKVRSDRRKAIAEQGALREALRQQEAQQRQEEHMRRWRDNVDSWSR